MCECIFCAKETGEFGDTGKKTTPPKLEGGGEPVTPWVEEEEKNPQQEASSNQVDIYYGSEGVLGMFPLY